MMIHAYFTDGMYDLAKVFLESLYRTNDSLFNVLLSTRNLTIEQIAQLKCLYPGHVEIENQELDMDELASRANCSLLHLVRYKEECERGYVTLNNKVWKLMIAAEDRPRSIYNLLMRGYGVSTPIIHFDIDTLFRRNIWPIVNHAMEHDCCLLLRENHNIRRARITISTMTWKRNERTMKFFERWMHYLDIMPPEVRPVGYGQTSCWFAFKELQKEGLDYYKLSKRWGYPGRSFNKKNNFVWSGAVNKLSKDKCVDFFKKEMEKLNV